MGAEFILEKNVILEGNNTLTEIKCWDGEWWERIYLKEGEAKASQESGAALEELSVKGNEGISMEGLIKKDIPGIEIGTGPQGVKA